MLKVISHRGNIQGRDAFNENKPDQILKVLGMGFDCEIDLWRIRDVLWLGHDEPIYRINLSFLLNQKIWVHAKNLNALYFCLGYKNIHCFWHQTDDFTLTSKNFIWTYPEKRVGNNSIIVDNSKHWKNKNYNCYGVCSDFIL